MIQDITTEDEKLRGLVVYELSHGLVDLPLKASEVHKRFAFYKRMIRRGSATLAWLEHKIVSEYGINTARKAPVRTLADVLGDYQEGLLTLSELYGGLICRRIARQVCRVFRPLHHTHDEANASPT